MEVGEEGGEGQVHCVVQVHSHYTGFHRSTDPEFYRDAFINVCTYIKVDYKKNIRFLYKVVTVFA